jgi:hypothetical protein
MRLGKNEPAVFLGLGIVSAQLQGFTNLRRRPRPMIGSTRPNPKILAPHRLQYFLNRSNGGTPRLGLVSLVNCGQ